MKKRLPIIGRRFKLSKTPLFSEKFHVRAAAVGMAEPGDGAIFNMKFFA